MSAPTSGRPIDDTLEGVGAVELEGWLSRRVDANTRRLLAVDVEPLLEGFRRKPGTHPWIGEHIGKWMHAASLAWEYERNEATKRALRAKLDYAAAELVKTQEPDGYLGTYTPDKRFGLFPGADWDVWAHKYCIIGLVAYANATGDAEALAAARRAADLLIETFGPGRKSIITAGTHVGIAATSVIEPMVLLSNATKERKYLDFALHVVKSYDDPGGPRLLESLTTHADVARTANGKAYEMLSNCVGLCELFRATGERRFLDAARNAFEDVVENQLYITGTASHHEHFHGGHDLPNAMAANVGETCVTVTWVQLCDQLLRLTGEAKYADEIERSVYNHLLGAQHPTRGDWCYYTSLDGVKPYTAETCCCLSSGPRGVAMIPSMVFMREGDATLVVNLFEEWTANVRLGGTDVRVEMESDVPEEGGATLTFAPSSGAARFGVKVRAPAWADPVTTPGVESRRVGGWCEVAPREWKRGDVLRIDFPIAPRVHPGTHSNAGRAAVTLGPLVMAFDESRNPGAAPAHLLWFDKDALSNAARRGARLTVRGVTAPEGRPCALELVPFAEAGADGGRYRVWLGAPGTLDPSRLTARELAVESRSRNGNVHGSIIDGDERTFVVTFDNTRQAEDWYAVEFHEPVEVRRVVFRHGRTFHDGGWFDTSAGPPRVEIRSSRDGAWKRVAVLSGYPKTTGTDPAGLKVGEAFDARLDHAVRAAAIRVIGVPAQGSNPAQAFSSCAELDVSADR